MADFTFLSLLLSGDPLTYCLEEAGCGGRGYKDDVREVQSQFFRVWSTDHWNQNNLREFVTNCILLVPESDLLNQDSLWMGLTILCF